MVSVVVLLTVGLLAAVTHLGGPARSKVPLVIDQDVAAATATLRHAGYVVHIETHPEDRKPGGIVVAQDPAGGASVKKGAAVRLKISGNTAKLAVPSVVKLDKTDAIAAIQAAGLVANVIEQKNDGVAAGTVFLQAPDATTAVDKGSTVTVTVSTGTVPPVAPPASQPATTSSPNTVSPVPTRTSPTVQPPRPPPTSGPLDNCNHDNLVVNGSFDNGFNGWAVTSGTPRTVTYGQTGFQAPPADYLGSSYAFGGPGGSAAGVAASLEQAVSLAPCQSGVAAGGKVLQYGGWLGGYLGQEDTVELTLHFRAGGRTLDETCTLIGPTAADRGGTTRMLEIGASACPIPPSATAAILQVRFTWDGTGVESDGSYDNAYLYVG